MTGTGILAIWNDCLPESETAYEDWYMGQHLPERVGVPGFRIGRRYQAVAADPRYFTYYDTDTPEVLWSEAYRERLANPTPETTAIMKSFRNMHRTVCRRVAQLGQFVAGHAVSVRLDTLPADYSRILSAMLEPTGVTGAEAWQRVEVPGDSASIEAKTRVERDRVIGAAMVFHVMREQDALETSDRLVRALGENAQIGAYQLLCELRNESL